MSLDWNLTRIPNHEKLCWEKNAAGEDRMNPRTEILIFMTMILGAQINDEKKAREFWRRLSVFQEVHGAMLHQGDADIFLTLEDVTAHIGLKTNATPLSKTAFNAKIMQGLEEKIQRKQKEVLPTNVLSFRAKQ